MKKKIILFFFVFIHAVATFGQKETRAIDSLKRELLTATDTSRILLLNELAREYRHYQPQFLLEYAMQANRLAQQADYKRGIAFSLLNIGLYKANYGDHQTALENYNQALALTRRYKFNDLQNLLLVASGNSLLRLNGDYTISKKYYDTALKNAIIGKDDKLLAEVYDRVAGVFSHEGLSDSASIYYLKALEIAERIKDSLTMGRVMINLGLEESNHGDTAKAMEYYQNSLAIATRIKNKMVAAYCLLDIACIWMDRKENEKAIYYFLKALALATELDYKTLIISLHIHIGYAFYGMGNYDKAFDYYSYGFELAKKNRELLQIIRILNGMGTVLKDKKDYKNAIVYLQQALETNKNADYKEELANTYLSLSQAYAGEADFKNAYRYLLLRKTVDSTLFNKDRELAKAEITTKYNTEKKTKEILVLKKDNEIKNLELSKSRVVIIAATIIVVLMVVIFLIFYNKFKTKRKANEEKEVLLREIHHRVKNNMQIILSILNLQARKTNDQNIINFIKESESRIQSMAIIHEKLYQSDNLASIPFRDYIGQLIEFIYKIYNVNKEQIEFIITAADIHLNVDTAVPLGLIINEVVCNSLKHGFDQAENGTIDIRLTSLPSKGYELIISDTGKGLPKNFDIKKTNTLGLKLIQTLIKQIGGKLEIGNGKGAVFSIHF